MRHDSEGFIPSDGEVERLQRSALNYTAPQLFPDNNGLGTIPRATDWGGVRGRPRVANINWLDRWGEVGNDYILPSFSNNLSSTGAVTPSSSASTTSACATARPRRELVRASTSSGNDSNFTAAQGNTTHAYANALVGSFRTTRSRPRAPSRSRADCSSGTCRTSGR